MVINVLQTFRAPSVNGHIVYNTKGNFALDLEQEICIFSSKREDSSDDGEAGWSSQVAERWTRKGWLLPPQGTSDALGSEPPCRPEAGSEPSCRP